MNEAGRGRALINDNEMDILVCLNRRPMAGEEHTPADITEIAYNTGIKDKEEVLRALYTLQGRSLVSPFPDGDFTSNHWMITNGGVKALELME